MSRRGGGKLVSVGSALAWLLASGCGLDQIEVELDDQLTIPSTALGTPFQPSYLMLQGVDFSARQELQNNEVEPGDIDAIFLRGARLEGTEPEKDDLGAILAAARFELEAPGLPRRRLAEKAPIPSGPSTELDFDPSFDLEPYGTAPSMSIQTDLELKEPRAFATTVRVIFTLLVDVNLGGL